MDGYSLSKNWFNFSFENNDKVSPSHTAMYLWFVELNNRMGWAEKFSSPASQTMSAIGLKSYNTYKKVFNELVEFGFVTVVMESRNQYTACIIAISNFDKANCSSLDFALSNNDNALTKHVTKQSESIDSIIKPKTIKPKTIKLFTEDESPVSNYSFCMDVYSEFIKSHTGVPPMINNITGTSLKRIIKYLSTIVRQKENSDQEIRSMFTIVFKHFDKWQPFHKGQLKMEQIESNLINIIAEIKIKSDGKSNSTKQQPISKYASQ